MGLREDIETLRKMPTHTGVDALVKARLTALLEPLAGLTPERASAVVESAELVMHWHQTDGRSGSQAEHYRRLAQFALALFSRLGEGS